MTCPTCGAPKFRAVCAPWCWSADPSQPAVNGGPALVRTPPCADPAITTYWRGCRCDGCREAMRLYNRNLRARRKAAA